MKKAGSKLLSTIMSLALVVGLCPGMAYAGEDGEGAESAAGTLVAATSGDLGVDGDLASVYAQVQMLAQAVVTEKEPNNSFEQANTITFGDTVNGAFNSSGKDDYYKVILPYAGPVILTFANDKYFTSTFGCTFYLYVYNQYYEEKGKIWTEGRYTRPETKTLQLSAGTNYIKYYHDGWTNNPGEGHPYHFKLAYDMSASSISLSSSSFVYDGRAKEPAVTVKCGSRTLTAGTDYTVSYGNNVNPGTAQVRVVGKGMYEGEVTTTFYIVTSSQSMYRLYNPNSGEHFYTASAEERDNVRAAGWNYEGEGWKAPVKSNTPVYRVYNKYGGEHHYTTSKSERDSLVKAGWNDEGIGWYSDDEQRTPLYRQYNPNQFACNHNYTTSKEENDYLVSIGWKYEGEAWYGV